MTSKWKCGWPPELLLADRIPLWLKKSERLNNIICSGSNIFYSLSQSGSLFDISLELEYWPNGNNILNVRKEMAIIRRERPNLAPSKIIHRKLNQFWCFGIKLKRRLSAILMTLIFLNWLRITVILVVFWAQFRQIHINDHFKMFFFEHKSINSEPIWKKFDIIW